MDRPVLKWRKPLELAYEIKVEATDTEVLYAEENNLYGYYVEGAPGLLRDNVASTRGLVNGSPFLIAGLYYEDVVEAARYERLSGAGVGEHEIEPPDAMLVRVGNAPGQEKAKGEDW